jgi:hypothetical protein
MTFQVLAGISFFILAGAFIIMDEPERGRFDVIHSVINNDSMSEDS